MTTVEQIDYDITIVGGGMVGIPLALGLARLGFKTALIEKFRLQDVSQTVLENSFDLRSTAISLGSVELLEGLGLWNEQDLHACPINQVHVSEQDRMGTTQINADDLNVNALGYVVPNMAMGALLYSELMKSDVSVFDQTEVQWVQMGSNSAEVCIKRLDQASASPSSIRTRLVVIADGSGSKLAKSLGIDFTVKSYQQTAIIANLETELENGGVAFERFAKTGPAALLPLKDAVSALVWTLPLELADEMLALPEPDFAKKVEALFGGRLGRILKVGERDAYPLSLTQAKELCRDRLLVVGNAAHSLHPVAGQGFNLALRGVAALLEGLAGRREERFWTLAHLKPLVEAHRNEQFKIVNFSDQLVELFSPHSHVPPIFRSSGLVALNSFKALKEEFARHMMGRAQAFSHFGGS